MSKIDDMVGELRSYIKESKEEHDWLCENGWNNFGRHEYMDNVDKIKSIIEKYKEKK